MEEFCECSEWNCNNCMCKCYMCSLTFAERMIEIEKWGECTYSIRYYYNKIETQLDTECILGKQTCSG